MDTSIVLVNDNEGFNIKAFDTNILVGHVTQSTIKMYKNALTKYIAYAGDKALQSTVLAQYRQHLVDSGLSVATINRELSSIKTTLRYAHEQGYIDTATLESIEGVKQLKSNALRERERTSKHTMVSKEDMRRLCDAPTNMMHKALLLTLASTGMRISEVVEMKVSQIIRVKRGYEVQGIWGKTDKELSRSCKISSEAVDMIHQWLNSREFNSEYVFTRSKRQGLSDRDYISSVAGWQLVQKYATKIGLEDVTAHTFRKFVGTTLAENDVKEAQLQLGHKSAQTTLNFYVKKKLRDDLVEDLF